jgi:hypothetical protein
MMMRNAPFATALRRKHGEARWTRYRFAVHHPGKRVKAGDLNSVIVDCDCAPFVNRVFVAGSFCRRKIVYDRLSPLSTASRSFRLVLCSPESATSVLQIQHKGGVDWTAVLSAVGTGSVIVF